MLIELKAKAEQEEIITELPIIHAYDEFYQFVRQAMIRGCEQIDGNEIPIKYFGIKKQLFQNLPEKYQSPIMRREMDKFNAQRLISCDPFRKLFKTLIPAILDRTKHAQKTRKAFFDGFPTGEVEKIAPCLFFSEKDKIGGLTVVKDLFSQGATYLIDKGGRLVLLPELNVREFLRDDLRLIKESQIINL